MVLHYISEPHPLNFNIVIKGVGVLLTAIRQGIMMSSTLLRRRLLVSLEIPNKDKSYEWFLTWMAARSNLHGAKWIKAPHLSVETLVSPETGARPFFNIVAGTGTHFFKFHGAWFQVSTAIQQITCFYPF